MSVRLAQCPQANTRISAEIVRSLPTAQALVELVLEFRQRGLEGRACSVLSLLRLDLASLRTKKRRWGLPVDRTFPSSSQGPIHQMCQRFHKEYQNQKVAVWEMETESVMVIDTLLHPPDKVDCHSDRSHTPSDHSHPSPYSAQSQTSSEESCSSC